MKSKVEKIVNKTRDSSSPTVKHDLSKPIVLMNRLIQKEIGSCAQLIGVDSEELQAWIDLQILAPAKTILSLLRIARQYQLDPLQEEILLTQYEDCWQVSISIDGWIKLMNKHPAFAGITFVESAETIESLPTWMECIIYRSDRVIPTTVREHFLEVRQDSDIWKKMPRRMLRHRTFQQCVRLAMGIYVKNNNENEWESMNPTTPELIPSLSSQKSSDRAGNQSNRLKEMLNKS